jgi:hypothetical protein
MRSLGRLKWLVTGIVTTFMAVGWVSATAASANISHSYQTSGDVPNGSIVSLDTKHSNTVQLANTSNGSRLLGVALASKDSLLAVDSTAGLAQIATSGNVNTLVSTLNGNIKVGDQIGVSPFGGIGMKALTGSPMIGVAQTGFSAGSAGAITRSVKDTAGKAHQIQLGYIRLGLAIGTSGSQGGGPQRNALQKLVKSLTGRTISTIRIILSIVVIAISLASLITLIYASVYGSIISIGRNPLAQHAVFRTLTSVMVMAILIIAIACVATFYLLH